MKPLLDQATQLAGKIDPHKVSPNPRVGCVVVHEGRIIAQGAHEYYGGPHAEVNALKDLETKGLSGKLSSCQMYITLEPCDAFEGKKTESCTQFLINKKPKKIIIGALDPQFQGQNVEKLRSMGIDTEIEAHPGHSQLNKFFDHWVQHRRPFITLKIAQSLDGKVRLNQTKGRVGYLTNKSSLQKVHELRAQYAAILTSTQTIIDDDPQFTCRLTSQTLPHRVSDPTLIIAGKREIPSSARIFEAEDRAVEQVRTHDLEKLINFCAQKNIDSLLVEAGPTFNTALLQSGLVDEILIFISPQIIGHGRMHNFHEDLSKNLAGFQLHRTMYDENDLLLHYQKTNP